MTVEDPNIAAVGEVAKATGEVAKVTGAVVKAVTANRDLANEAAKGSPGQDVLGKIRNENLILASVLQNGVLKAIVRMVMRNNEYVASGEIFLDLAPKLQGVPLDQLQPPKASIAGPVMEGLQYALDEPALKEMYLNLLANAMKTETSSRVHPSFASIVRMLSSEEVPALDLLLRRAVMKAARPRIRLAEHGVSLHFMVDRNAMRVMSPFIESSDGPGPFTSPDVPIWIANWERLGLVELQLDGEVVSRETLKDDVSDWAVERPEFLAAVAFAESIAPNDVASVGVERGVVRTTPLGERFFDTVCARREGEYRVFDSVYQDPFPAGAARVRVSFPYLT